MKDNLITDTTRLAWEVTKNYIKEGDTAVDATCGRGSDTVRLAEAVGTRGIVYAFDIQEEAIAATKAALEEAGIAVPGEGGRVRLIPDSFENMESYAGAKRPAAILFNLGYLPGGDKSVTTTAETTLRGLAAALRLVAAGGIISVVMYCGHAAGKAEKEAVLEWAENLDRRDYHVVCTKMLNQPNDPPEVLWITKKRKEG